MNILWASNMSFKCLMVDIFVTIQLQIKTMLNNNDHLPQQQLSVPLKISDCIYMGDELIAHDIQWLTLNQITHVINCAGRQCPNNTVVKGMCFLTFDWTENNIQNIVDQNVVNAVVGFIDEAKQQHGTVLLKQTILYHRNIFNGQVKKKKCRYQWNIYKVLEYLNSRKEGIEVDQVFIHQLNNLHTKLMERGLIKSKQWNITAQTTQEEVLLTNTFLNSRRRQGQRPASKKKKKNVKSLSWKNKQSQEHQYDSSSVIAQINPARPSVIEVKPRSDSVKSRKQQQPLTTTDVNKSLSGKILVAKQVIKADKTSSILTEMNVTKKWTDLRQAWMKQKENICQNLNKLNEEGKQNRIIHNNWIINNQILKENTNKNQKNPSSKSVIVVKPNYAIQPTDNSQRSMVRKAGSQRKTQKQQPQKKFFGQDKTVFGERGRCSSVKQQRKQLGNSLILKNSSISSKGKWKM